MADTRLTDIIEPSVFNDYVLEKTTELDVLFQSGVVAPHADITKHASAGGSLINVPFWNDLASNEPNVGSDNPASNSTPDNITAGADIAIKHRRNNSWSAMDLVAAVAGSDPMAQIGDLVARYWARVNQKALIETANGVIADNVANDAGDMVVNIATDDVAAVSAAELISGDAVIDAMQTMGDAKESLAMIAMHSVVHSRLQKQNLITTVHNSDGKVMFQEYMGKKVLVDDGLPAVAGANRITYTSLLLGTGAFAYGEGAPRTPHEVERKAAAGDGEGQEILHSRKHFVLHPRGVKFASGSMAGVSPTNAELALAANWDRVVDRKAVRIVALKTNG